MGHEPISGATIFSDEVTTATKESKLFPPLHKNKFFGPLFANIERFVRLSLEVFQSFQPSRHTSDPVPCLMPAFQFFPPLTPSEKNLPFMILNLKDLPSLTLRSVVMHNSSATMWDA